MCCGEDINLHFDSMSSRVTKGLIVEEQYLLSTVKGYGYKIFTFEKINEKIRLKIKPSLDFIDCLYVYYDRIIRKLFGGYK